MAESILDLSTILTRPTVKVDGTAYELRHPDELSLAEQQALRQWGKDIDGAFQDGADAENASKGEHALQRAVALLMPEIPPDVAARLSDTQRLAILQGFTRLASASILASGPSGGDSSHGSNASTADGPAIGSGSPVSTSPGMPR